LIENIEERSLIETVEKTPKKNEVSNKKSEKNKEVEPKKENKSKLPANKTNQKIEVVEKQVLNETSKEEVEIFKNTNPDGSVEYKEEWRQYLNYYKGEYYHDINYFSGDVREKLATLESERQELQKEQYEKQKKGLLAIVPEYKKINDISFDPLDRFIVDFTTGEFGRKWTGR